MLLPKFDYQVPKSLREACALLDEYGAKAKLLAGGTDLLVNLKRKTLAPEQVISLNKIKGLDEAAAKKGKGILHRSPGHGRLPGRKRIGPGTLAGPGRGRRAPRFPLDPQPGHPGGQYRYRPPGLGSWPRR